MRYCALGVSEGWQMRQRATDVPQLPISVPTPPIPSRLCRTLGGLVFATHACMRKHSVRTFAASTNGLQYPVISV